MKNTRKGINSRLSNTEQWIRDLENRLVEINWNSRKKKEF